MHLSELFNSTIDISTIASLSLCLGNVAPDDRRGVIRALRERATALEHLHVCAIELHELVGGLEDAAVTKMRSLRSLTLHALGLQGPSSALASHLPESLQFVTVQLARFAAAIPTEYDRACPICAFADRLAVDVAERSLPSLARFTLGLPCDHRSIGPAGKALSDACDERKVELFFDMCVAPALDLR